MPAKTMQIARRRRNKGANKSSMFPGPYVQSPVFRRKLRYQAQGTESKDADYVTMASLQNLLYIQSNSSTVANGYFSAIRLNSVEVWADSVNSNSFTTIGLDWLSPDAPNKQTNATGNSFRPAHFKVKPPKECAAGKWYAGQLLAQGTPTSIVASSPYAFALLTSQSGAILEIDLSFTVFEYDTLNNPFVVTTAGGGQANTLTYNSYLDNTSVSLGNGTKNWLIQGVVNISPGYVSSW
jgi:hypothetical protein